MRGNKDDEKKIGKIIDKNRELGNKSLRNMMEEKKMKRMKDVVRKMKSCEEISNKVLND